MPEAHRCTCDHTEKPLREARDGLFHTVGCPALRLACEDPENGLYIHQLNEHGDGVKVTTINDGATPPGEISLVDAVDFMEVQKERDEYRRTLAVINAWRLVEAPESVARPDGRLSKLLRDAGFTDADAKAVNGILEWARNA